MNDVFHAMWLTIQVFWPVALLFGIAFGYAAAVGFISAWNDDEW